MMDTRYLRDVLALVQDIRSMAKLARNNEGGYSPDDWLEFIGNAADQLYSAASEQLREAERAEWHALLNEK